VIYRPITLFLHDEEDEEEEEEEEEMKASQIPVL